MANTKFYHVSGTAIDKDGIAHNVVVVGKLERNYVQMPVMDNVSVDIKENSTVAGKLFYSKRIIHRVLTTAHSICNPADEYDEMTGISIAMSRIRKHKDSGKLETNNVTMLTEDMIMGILNVKLTYIQDNIDRFIAINKKDDKAYHEIEDMAIGI